MGRSPLHGSVKYKVQGGSKAFLKKKNVKSSQDKFLYYVLLPLLNIYSLIKRFQISFLIVLIGTAGCV